MPLASLFRTISSGQCRSPDCDAPCWVHPFCGRTCRDAHHAELDRVANSLRAGKSESEASGQPDTKESSTLLSNGPLGQLAPPEACMCGYQSACLHPRASDSLYCIHCTNCQGSSHQCDCYCAGCFPFVEESAQPIVESSNHEAAADLPGAPVCEPTSQAISNRVVLSLVDQALDIACANTMDSASQISLAVECFSEAELQAVRFFGIWPSMCLEYDLIYSSSSAPLYERLALLYEWNHESPHNFVRREGLPDRHFLSPSGQGQGLPDFFLPVARTNARAEHEPSVVPAVYLRASAK